MMAPEDIWRYYERAQVALTVLRRAAALGWPECGHLFIGMTDSDVNGVLYDMRVELDAQVAMALIASFEAMLRLDFLRRARGRKSMLAAKKMKALSKRYAKRVALDDILDVWRVEIGKKQAIAQFRNLIRYRHWLAHGRYWIQKSGMTPDPEDAWSIAEALFRELPGFPAM